MSGQIVGPQTKAVETLLSPRDQDRRNGIQRMRSLSHAGLVWERYLDVWSRGASPALAEGTTRREALSTFASDFNARIRAPKVSPNHPRKLLETLHARQARAGARLRGESAVVEATLKSRLAMGLGTPHPSEIGFTFDRAVGVPYLPGSSVKGLCRATARMVDEPLQEVLFGPDRSDRDDAMCIGELVFLDAYPSTWPRLEVDVINCHHPKYYAGIDCPTETEDPVPVYFLTVASDTKWTFSIHSKNGTHLGRAVELLQAGLRDLGAGAKTAVGYGVFEKSR